MELFNMNWKRVGQSCSSKPTLTAGVNRGVAPSTSTAIDLTSNVPNGSRLYAVGQAGYIQNHASKGVIMLDSS